MHKTKFVAAAYAATAVHRARIAAHTTKEYVKENKSEMAISVATTLVVWTVARADGFKAGYAAAQSQI